MAEPFWKTSEKIQRVLWKTDEDTLDNVWQAADGQLKPHDGVWDGRDVTTEGVMLFRLGQLTGAQCEYDVWGFDTGANYMAIFIGDEGEVTQRLKKCGVAL